MRPVALLLVLLAGCGPALERPAESTAALTLDGGGCPAGYDPCLGGCMPSGEACCAFDGGSTWSCGGGSSCAGFKCFSPDAGPWCSYICYPD